MRIALLQGFEDSFPEALGARLEEESGGADRLELLQLEIFGAGDGGEFSLVLDRGSRDVAFYGGVLRALALRGTRVVNDPLALAGGDGFIALERCRRAGLPAARCLLVPQKRYPETIGPACLRNLVYPLPWERCLERLGGRAWLESVRPGGVFASVEVPDGASLLAAYDGSGEELLMLREILPWERYVRCLCFGGGFVLPSRFDPEWGQYLLDPGYLEPELEARVIALAARASELQGLDLNAVEVAIVGGEPVVARAYDPFPDLGIAALGPLLFEKAVAETAALLRRLADAESGTRGEAVREESPARTLEGVVRPLRRTTGRRTRRVRLKETVRSGPVLRVRAPVRKVRIVRSRGGGAGAER